MRTINAFTQFVVLASLPLLLGGCGDERWSHEQGARVYVKEAASQGRGFYVFHDCFFHEVTDKYLILKTEDDAFFSIPKERVISVEEISGKEGYVVSQKLDGVVSKELELRNGITYLKVLGIPYTGKSFSFYPNGQKRRVGNYKDGKQDGLFVAWQENGKRRFQEDFKNGESVEGSAKAWNSRGERTYSLEEAKEEEPVIVTKPALEGVNEEELEFREGIAYLKGSDTPYTGQDFLLHENGQKKGVGNYKDGKENGLFVAWDANGRKKSEINYKGGKEEGVWMWWHENGQKGGERNYRDGVLVSRKWWNDKGEPIDVFGRRINDP